MSRNYLPSRVRSMSEAEAAWVAGLLEGEGCFTGHKSIKEPSKHYRIAVCMTDVDVLEMLAEITGAGSVRAVRETVALAERLGKKPLYAWHSHRILDVRDICLQIYPWMGVRRKSRIDEILRATESIQTWEPGHCRKGHPISGDNVYTNPQGAKFCRECARERARGYTAARRAKRNASAA